MKLSPLRSIILWELVDLSWSGPLVLPLNVWEGFVEEEAKSGLVLTLSSSCAASDADGCEGLEEEEHLPNCHTDPFSICRLPVPLQQDSPMVARGTSCGTEEVPTNDIWARAGLFPGDALGGVVRVQWQANGGAWRGRPKAERVGSCEHASRCGAGAPPSIFVREGTHQSATVAVWPGVWSCR